MLQIILAYSTGSLIFLAFYLIVKRNRRNKLGNNWLNLFLISLIGAFLAGSIREFKLHIIYPHLYKIGDLNSFTIAPSLFLAIKYFTTPLNRIRKIDWLHFVPTVCFVAFNAKYFFYKPESLSLIIQSPPLYKELFMVLKYFLVVQCLIYILLSLIKLRKYQKTIELYDASDRISLQWLKYFLYGMTIMLAVWVLNLKGLFGDYIYLAYGFCIYYLGYYVVNQAEIFPYSEITKNELNSLIDTEALPKDIKNQTLSVSILEDEKNKLSLIMQNDKPFLDNELNLVKLAQIQGINIRELSFVINEGFGENFNQFINKYRVEESKRILSDPGFKHLNMLGVAYQAGFNSKTIFNTTFKKLTGFTPSEFRNQN